MPEPLDLDRLKADLETAARAVRGASWPGEMAQRMDELADRLAAYPAQILDERATLEAERDELADDVTRAVTERNEVARLAAAEIHPGPDAADDEIRREMIAGWLDEGRDDAEGWLEAYRAAGAKLALIAAERDDARAARGQLIETVREVADIIARWSISGSTASTLRKACDRAESPQETERVPLPDGVHRAGVLPDGLPAGVIQLHWTPEGWAHGPSGTSGTLGEMLHFIVSAYLTDACDAAEDEAG